MTEDKLLTAFGVLCVLCVSAIIIVCICASHSPTDSGKGIPPMSGIHKFTDGTVTCYTIYEHGISCLEITQ